jgi:hypothetical protein
MVEATGRFDRFALDHSNDGWRTTNTVPVAPAALG